MVKILTPVQPPTVEEYAFAVFSELCLSCAIHEVEGY